VAHGPVALWPEMSTSGEGTSASSLEGGISANFSSRWGGAYQRDVNLIHVEGAVPGVGVPYAAVQQPAGPRHGQLHGLVRRELQGVGVDVIV
jgi:hypothetical protein